MFGNNCDKDILKSSRRKKFILIVVALLIAAGAVTATALILNNGDEAEVRLVDKAYAEYMLIDADKDMELEIDLPESVVPEYRVRDLNGGDVGVTQAESKDVVAIEPPKGGYTPGEIYTIKLDKDSSFTDKKYSKAKSLTFIIADDEKTDCSYAETVKKVSDASEKDGKVRTSEKCKAGDIVVQDNGSEEIASAYKVKSVTEQNGKYTFQYTEPKIDEVYENLDINKEIVSDTEYLKVNKGAVLEAAENMGILDAFVDEAEALSMKDIDAKVRKDGDNGISVTITLHDPSDKARKLELEMAVKYKTKVIVKNKYSFVDSKLSFTDGVKVSVEGEDDESVKGAVEKAIDTFGKSTKGNIKKSKAAKKYFVDIFKVQVPIWGTVNFYADLGIDYSFKVSGKATVGLEAGVDITQGVLMKKGKLVKSYGNAKPHLDGKVLLTGNVYETIGLGGELGVELLPGSSIGFKASPGVYGDMTGHVLLESIKKPKDIKGYYDLEAGVKVDVDLVLSLNYIIDKFEYEKNLLGKRFPLLKIENITRVKGVNLKSTYDLEDGQIHIGELKAIYENAVTKDTTAEILKSYKIYINGKQVKPNAGKIGANLKEGNCKIKVTWKKNDKTYEYEKSVKLEKMTVSVDTLLYYCSYIGATAKEIEQEFGEMTTKNRQWSAGGAQHYQVANSKCWFSFPFSYNEKGKSGYDIEKDYLYMNSKCILLSGDFDTFIEFKKEKYSRNEIENILRQISGAEIGTHKYKENWTYVAGGCVGCVGEIYADLPSGIRIRIIDRDGHFYSDSAVEISKAMYKRY